MSDIQDLLGGSGTVASGTDQQGAADQGNAARQGKQKRKPTPKPAWVVQREKATGIDAQWSDAANAGRGGYVFPGLSSKMGGPAKGAKPADQGGEDKHKAARKAFTDGDYASAYEALVNDPAAQTDPVLKQVLALSKSYMGL